MFGKVRQILAALLRQGAVSHHPICVLNGGKYLLILLLVHINNVIYHVYINI